MIRALLAGRKTQTRRIIKPQPTPAGDGLWHFHNRWGGISQAHEEALTSYIVDAAARYAVGDRLWVRENWRPIGDAALSECVGPEDVMFAASVGPIDLETFRWRPSIHMPRWASRLTLIVTGVKVERLKDISEADAITEGIERVGDIAGEPGWKHYPNGSAAGGWLDPRESFRTLWQSINGPESWEANPWVVAVSFTVHRRNIDQMSEVT